MAKAAVTVDCSELVALAKQLGDFFDPAVAKPSPLGKAVAAGARNVYLELQRRVPVAKAGDAKDPGLLRDAVYRFWDPKDSPNANQISYKVGVNVTKAPHWWLADKGHKVYENYAPFKFPKNWSGYKPAGDQARWFGTPYISRNKDGKNRMPKGPVVADVNGHEYREKAFSQSVLKNALDIVVEVYLEQFNEAMARN